jgi:predicted RNase H-like nuclease (RuvC/YqgF family)
MSDLELTMMRRVGELNKENARLKAEVERLQNNCDHLDQKLDEELDKSAMLCGQVERLTKAGDAMAKQTEFFQKRWDADELCQEVEAWNAAKEGKQP